MNEMVCNVKVRFKGVEKSAYFGRGIAQLLYGIKKYHSLNMAAKHLGMAYSKAWRIMRDAEDSLGVELIDRHGNSGAAVSPEGSRILDIYEEAELAAEKAAEQILSGYFGNIRRENAWERDKANG